MKSIAYLFLLWITLFVSVSAVQAQSGRTHIRGQVLEANSRQPIEFATVMVVNKTDQQPDNGTTTAPDGTFEVQTTLTDFYLEVSFIGYAATKVEDITLHHGKADVGQVLLSENSQTLDEVIVRADKSTTEFKLDKRVFNVGEELSSAGLSALEVLNHVPSVNVNIEGQVSLRGSSGVQILINGKPSVLASEEGNALGTITAEMIDRVEVITNPSAKYEAEGTSGIINIVIKKEERRGLNGSVSLNTGVPHNHSVGLSLNRRTEKFNLFSQLGVGYREMPYDNESINEDLTSGQLIYSTGSSFRNETFYNVILGTDYHIDANNVLTLSGNFAYEVEDQPSETFFTQSRSDGMPDRQWQREEITEATNPKWQYELQYKRDFKDQEDHVLLFSALGTFFGKDQSSDFFNTAIVGDIPHTRQQTRTDFGEAKYTFQLDYTHPFSEQFTVEAGAHYVLQHVKNDYAVTDLINDTWVVNPKLTNVFDFDQNVLGLYTTAGYEGNKWGLKVGLRAENTDLSTLLETTQTTNERNFTNLFSSLHSSYKLTDRLSVQAGYSRRIFRPRLWHLNPFFNIRNNFSVRTGNPNLLPEFTDSYEVNAIYILDKITMNLGVYHRYTTDVVERVTTFADNINTTMPINIGTSRSTGLEFNAKYSPVRGVTLNADANYNYFTREGELEGASFDFDADRWSAKLLSKFKLSSSLDMELTGNYRSGVETVQGFNSGNAFADFGLRQKILKGKAVVNLAVRDIFASRFRENEIFQDDFYAYTYGQRGRFITLGFSYGFGKGEAMQYSGARRHH